MRDLTSQPASATEWATTWSAQQIERLDEEWRRLRRAFAYHPHVHIVPVKGNPPSEYQIEYRLRSLVMEVGQALDFTDRCTVHLWLPPAFPQAAPLVRPMSAVFHPNIVLDAVCLIPSWTATSTLTDVVTAVGRMLTYQVYDPTTVWNDVAMQWVNDNPQWLPVDPEADLSPEAGGDPLARIGRHGQRTLDHISAQIGQFCDALAADALHSDRALATFIERSRLALGLFLDTDVVDGLRHRAAELTESLRDLGESLHTWDLLRRQQRVAAAAVAIAQTLTATRQSVSAELRDIEGMVSETSGPLPIRNVLRRLPDVAAYATRAARLIPPLNRMRAEIEEAEERLRQIEDLPAAPEPRAGVVGQRLRAARTAAMEKVLDARQKVVAELAIAQPLLKRADARHAGLARMSKWREYVDLIDRAHNLVNKLTTWGAAGVEACFIENEAGRFGPFAFEQELSLGPLSVVARSAGPTGIEVIDAATGEVRARGETGTASVSVRDPQSQQAYVTTFRLTARCDELAVQLSYLVDQTRQGLDQLKERFDAGDSWITRYNEGLTAPEAQAALAKAQASHEARWMALCEDLTALAPLKQRLATHFLIERLLESAPRLKQRLAEAGTAMEEATRKLAEIAQTGTTISDTGRVQVPARHAAEYKKQMLRREQARDEAPRVTRLLELEAQTLAARIGSAELLGNAAAPQLRALGALPPEHAELLPSLALGALRESVHRLGQIFGRTFEFARTDEPDYPPSEQPAEPEQAPQRDDVEHAAQADGDTIDWTILPEPADRATTKPD